MSRVVLKGNQLARRIAQQAKQAIATEVAANMTFYSSRRKFAAPTLHIINVGLHDASLSYISKKIDIATSIGMGFQLHQFIEKVTPKQRLDAAFVRMYQQSSPDNFRMHHFDSEHPQKCYNQIASLVYKLNRRTEVSGILMQLPLPAPLEPFTRELIDRIQPMKDVDCLNIENRAKVIEHAQPDLKPCTPAAVLRILDEHGIDVKGKRVVIAGRSLLVGLPLFHLLLNRNATITLCHQFSQDLDTHTQEADIVISAVGKPDLITKLKPGAICIDVGISRNQLGKLNGDISKEAKRDCSLSTPVPGGVGPMTVAMLMENTVKLWKTQMRLQQSRFDHKNSESQSNANGNTQK